MKSLLLLDQSTSLLHSIDSVLLRDGQRLHTAVDPSQEHDSGFKSINCLVLMHYHTAFNLMTR